MKIKLVAQAARIGGGLVFEYGKNTSSPILFETRKPDVLEFDTVVANAPFLIPFLNGVPLVTLYVLSDERVSGTGTT